MSSYPYSKLCVGPSRTIAISGPHIQVLDSATGQVLYSTAKFPEEEGVKVEKAGAVRCIALSSSGRYIAAAGDDKMLRIWEVEGLKLSSERELPKKPTGVAFTQDEKTILVSDKFGDVFSYEFVYIPPTEKQKRDALSSHENPSKGKLILGHASPLNAFLLTPDEKYIITADRDEHIRISWYPQGYCIERYCLGHEKFVSAIHIPQDTSTLISGGGDPMLKFWNWFTGEVKHELQIVDTVDPFLVVRAPKRKRGSWDNEGEEGESNRTKRKKAKAKARAEAKKETSQEPGAAAPDEQEEEEEEESKDIGEGEEESRKVLVVHQIGSVNTEAGEYLIFSAVGASALFAFPSKLDVTPEMIQAFDFGVPVVGFTTLEDGSIWVSLDQSYKGSGAEDRKPLEVLKFVDGKLQKTDDSRKDLIASLNSSTLPATAEELKVVDLYGGLVSLPKHPEADGEEDNVSVAEAEKEKPQTKRELARLKKKQAVMKQLEAAKEGSAPVGDEEPESKRARSERREEKRDVVMEG